MRVVTFLLVAAAIAGCGASPAATAGQSPTSRPVPESPEEMARLFCPQVDVEFCVAEVLAAADAGQPAALCTGPQSDRYNIVVPEPSDVLGSPCGPDDKGTIQGFIVGQ
jgi:hypothetical protein